MYWSEFEKGNKTLSFELYFSSLRQKLGKISDNCKKKAKKLKKNWKKKSGVWHLLLKNFHGK